MKQKAKKLEGLKDIHDIRTDLPPFPLGERIKLLFGYRVSLITRVEVDVEIMKCGPTHFSYKYEGGQVAVWKPKAAQRQALSAPEAPKA